MQQWQVNATAARERYGNALLTYNDQTYTINGWANALKLHPDTILSRLWQRYVNRGRYPLDQVFHYRKTPVPDDWKDF